MIPCLFSCYFVEYSTSVLAWGLLLMSSFFLLSANSQCLIMKQWSKSTPRKCVLHPKVCIHDNISIHIIILNSYTYQNVLDVKCDSIVWVRWKLSHRWPSYRIFKKQWQSTLLATSLSTWLKRLLFHFHW